MDSINENSKNPAESNIPVGASSERKVRYKCAAVKRATFKPMTRVERAAAARTERIAAFRAGLRKKGIDHPEDFYELEAIRDKRIQNGQAQYMIKWLGWPESSNTWEPRENLEDYFSDDVDAFEEELAKRSRSGESGATVAPSSEP